MKKIISFFAVCSLILLAGCSATSKKTETLKTIQLDPEADKVLVDTDTDIHIKTDPATIQLTDKDFTCSGGNVKVTKDNAEFSASDAGTYTISAKQGNVTSNTITITVVAEESELVAAADTDQTTSSAPATDDSQTTSNDATTSTDNTASSSSNAGSSASTQTQTQNPGEASPDAIDVATILSDPDDYVGQSITIIGALPQTAAYDANNNPYEIIYPTSGGSDINDPSDRLRLEGANVTIGGCIAELTGTLEKQKIGNNQYVFNVTSFEEVSDESAHS